MRAPRQTFAVVERLKRQRDIDALFQSGKAHSFFPVRAVVRVLPRPEGEWAPVRLGVSAPKRAFRRAHDRARVKRLLREAWRLQKAALYEALPESTQLHLFLLYTGKDLPDFTTVHAAVAKAIDWLKKQGCAPVAGA